MSLLTAIRQIRWPRGRRQVRTVCSPDLGASREITTRGMGCLHALIGEHRAAGPGQFWTTAEAMKKIESSGWVPFAAVGRTPQKITEACFLSALMPAHIQNDASGEPTVYMIMRCLPIWLVLYQQDVRSVSQRSSLPRTSGAARRAGRHPGRGPRRTRGRRSRAPLRLNAARGVPEGTKLQETVDLQKSSDRRLVRTTRATAHASHGEQENEINAVGCMLR